MMKAGLYGGLTALGTFLATWAVYRGVRLDWPETALMIGAVSLAIGMQWIIHFMVEVFGCEDEE